MINTERIEPLAQSLAADGYELKVAENGSRVAVTVVAGPDACEDCLVPKDLMRGILANALGADGDSIDITYPKEVSS
ncbi:MAG: hypothetical protein FWE35_08915 [Streptosporangiales bacterium]|nr:hypothetical protein [Streptosporangiales bacterium]